MFFLFFLLGYITALIYRYNTDDPILLWFLRLFPNFCVTEGFFESYTIALKTSICTKIHPEVLIAFCYGLKVSDDLAVSRCCPGNFIWVAALILYVFFNTFFYCCIDEEHRLNTNRKMIDVSLKGLLYSNFHQKWQ